MRANRKRRLKVKTLNGETLLPEAMIQHIQSFLTGKEAARTTLLSKSWYHAWLTRPTLDFDESDFKKPLEVGFAEFATKSMRRYQDLNLKIESFRLRTITCRKGVELLANKLIANAMKMGAKDLSLELRSAKFVSLRKSLRSRLKSLTLDRVHMQSDNTISKIISCCTSTEELSLSNCRSSFLDYPNGRMLALSASNLYKLRKLRRLFLEFVEVDPWFFEDFASRFPCLKDLSVVRCYVYKSIQIHSTSLERISFLQVMAFTAELHVPNLVSFTYSGAAIPSVSIESSREFESHISITRGRLTVGRSWFVKLNKSLTKFSPSKISLSIKSKNLTRVDEADINHVPRSLVVLENLTFEPPISSHASSVLVGIVTICRPKFITFYWLPHSCDDCWTNNESLDFLRKRLMMRVNMITPNCGIPDKNTFGQSGLKEVKVELYEENLREWRPLLLDASKTPENKRKIRFQLRW